MTLGAMSIDGIISNLKTSELIAKLMEVERKPIRILQNKRANYETKVTAWQEANAKMLALKAAISPLRHVSAFEGKKATSSNENILSANASTSAVAGNYSVKVNQIARAHGVASDAQLINEASTPLARRFGFAVNQTFTITINNVSTPVTINTNDTLADMRNKINTSGAEVTATIINDTETTQRIVIASKNTGSSHTMSFTDSANGILRNLGILTLTGAVKNELVPARNAIIVVNGLTVTRSTNTITDAIGGLTLNLKRESTETVTIGVTSNTENIKTNISNFVTQYNSMIKFFRDQFYYDAENKKSGTLFGDSILISIQKSLQDAVFSNVDARLTSEIVGMGDGIRGANFGEFALSSKITSISDIKKIMLGTTSISFGGEGTGAGSTGWYAEVKLNGELRFFKNGVATVVENAKSIKATYAPAEKVNIQGTRYNLSKTINSIKNITRITAVHGGDTRNFVVRGVNGRTGSGYEVEVNTSSSLSNGELLFYNNNTLIAEGNLSNVKASYISSSALSSITQLGFSVYAAEDASIKLDEATLSSQLQNNLESVRDLFNKSYEALAYKIDDYLNTLTQRISGIIDLTITGIKSQVNSTKERISKLEKTMSYRERTYKKMFYEMERAIGIMQSQSVALSQQINRLPSSWMLTPRSTSQ